MSGATGGPPGTLFTVVGGFLGAGKTTLLNNLLRETRGLRIAVLVNDFGAINIDGDLIASHDGATIRLANGCVCCSLEDGFFETIARIANADEPFDRIVVEASGVADPSRIAEIAGIEPKLLPGAIVVLADAGRLPEQIGDRYVGDTVRRQLSGADLVVLNKCDLAAGARLDAARRAVRSVRPDVRMVETVHGDTAEVLDILDAHRKPVSAGLPPDHESEFRRWTYVRDGAFERAALESALSRLPNTLLRLKGPCAIAGEEPALLQMAGGDWTLGPMPTAGAAAPASGIRLAGIGTATLAPAPLLDAVLDAALRTDN